MRKTQLLKLIAILLVCVLGMQSPALANSTDHTSTTAYGEEIELEELRTTDSKTYQLSDGSFQYVGYADDVHYKDSNGKFAEIDNSITNSAEKDGYAYTNTANSWRAYFSNQLSTSKAVLLETDDYSLSFSMPSANQPGTAKKSVDIADPECSYYEDKKSDNRAVVYQEVLTDVDVVYTVKTLGIKEDIVLKNAAAPHSFEFALTADELTAVEKNGTIYFQDRAGDDIFHIGSLYMIDTNGKCSESVTCSIHQVKNGYSLVISASEEFLNAEDTVYPVIIDPSIMVTGSSDTFDTCVDEQYPSSNYYSSENLWTGGATGTNTMRTYIKFTMPSNITASQVTSATLRIKKREYQTPTIKAYRVTSNWSSSSVTWNNKPSYTTTNGTGTITLDTGSWYKLDTTTLVKYWLAGTYSNYGFLLKEPSETNSSQKTKFYSSDAPSPNKPELVINYNAQATTYTITYNGNGNTGGSIPESQSAVSGSSVTLRANTGMLSKSGYSFYGWSTNSSGTGTIYRAGQTITMPSYNLTLYAKWVKQYNMSVYYTPGITETEKTRMNDAIDTAVEKYLEYGILIIPSAASSSEELNYRTTSTTCEVIDSPNVECSGTCGSRSDCSSKHHRYCTYYLNKLTSSQRVLRIVDWALCNTSGTSDGYTNSIGGNNMVCNANKNDLNYLIIHELAHTFGLKDGYNGDEPNCEGDCIMYARGEMEFCNHCKTLLPN